MHRSIIGLATLALISSALVGMGTNIAHGENERKCTLSNPCFVSTSSGRMAYIEHKPSGAPSATVILLHGYTDSKRSWSLAMEELRKQDPSLRIIAVDQRGHGQSFRPRSAACRKNPGPCFTPAVMADDLADFMAAKDIERAYISGHSMGSVVAQYFAKRHPDRTSGVVLVASAVDLKANPVLDDWLLKGPILGKWKPALEAKGYAWPEDAIKADLLDADPNAVEWLEINWNVNPIAPGWFVANIAEETARVRMQTWLGVAAALGQVDNVKGLSTTKTPILALWGTQDSYPHKSDQETLISALRAASKVGGSFCWKQYGVIPLGPGGFQTDDLGHNLQWEAPRQVAKDISSFIRTGRPTTDLYRTDAPSDSKTILTERGKAELVCG